MKLRLVDHTIDEWCHIRAAQARALGCSEEFVAWLVDDLRRRYR